VRSGKTGTEYCGQDGWGVRGGGGGRGEKHFVLGETWWVKLRVTDPAWRMERERRRAVVWPGSGTGGEGEGGKKCVDKWQGGWGPFGATFRG